MRAKTDNYLERLAARITRSVRPKAPETEYPAAKNDCLSPLARQPQFMRAAVKRISDAEDEYMFGPEIPEKKLVFLARHESTLKDNLPWLKAHMTAVSFCDDPFLAQREVRHCQDDGVIFVVDVDIFGDLDRAVEFLLKSRSLFPDVPIVIASQSFSCDDLSRERAAIADASLRLPTNRLHLGRALDVAQTNLTAEKQSPRPV